MSTSLTGEALALAITRCHVRGCALQQANQPVPSALSQCYATLIQQHAEQAAQAVSVRITAENLARPEQRAIAEGGSVFGGLGYTRPAGRPKE